MTQKTLATKEYVDDKIAYSYPILKNGWRSNGHEPLLIRCGGCVTFNALIRAGEGSKNTSGEIVMIIPAGYRPSISLVCIASTPTGNGIFIANDNGNVSINTPVAYTGNVQISGTWII